MITSKLTTLIGAMRLGGAGTFVLGNPYSQTLAALASKLFSNGELGLYYDTNDLYYMYQDMAGSIPVTTAGQQVGLILDKSKGLQLGNELFTIFGSTLSATLSKNTPPCVVTSTTAFGVYGLVGSLTLQPKTYKIEFSWEGNDNNAQMAVQLPNGNKLNIGTEKSGTFSRIMSFTSPGYFSITKFNPQVGQTFTVTAVSIKEVLGNHAYQPVNSMRPTLRFNALANSYYLDFDNIDDKLLVTLPAPLTGCTNFRSIPDVGTRARYNQTIPTIFEITSSFASLLIINRSLTFAEKLNLVDKMDKYAGYSGIDSNVIKLFDTEQGFVYDFNDLTAEKLKWRRNLLTETEFRNGLTDVPVRAGDTVAASFAGLNLNTGIRINQQVGTHSYAYKTFTQTVGVLYSFSAYVRMLDGSAPVIGGTSALATEDFAIVLGGRVANLPNRTLTHLGGGLYKVTAVTPDTFLSSSFGFIKYGTNSNKGFVVSGYQLEVGTVTTPYQPFTDFNSEFIAAFPYHTLYQDASGTIPVTAAGQPVGLVLDKSKGLFTSNERCVNGDFSAGLTGWVNNGNYWTVTNGRAYHALSSVLNALDQVLPPSQSMLKITFDMEVISGTGQVNIVPSGNIINIGVSSKKTYTMYAPIGTSSVQFKRVAPGITAEFYVDNVSIKEVLGNHAFQSVSGSRPLLGRHPTGGARNLFSYSNDFSNAVWIKAQSLLTPVNIAAPDGTLTAIKLVEGTQPTAYHQLYQSYAATDITKPVTFSFYAKAAELTKVNIMANWLTVGHFDLANGTATGAGRTITPVGNGWYRCSVTGTPPDTTSRTYVVQLINSSGQEQYTGNGVSGVYVWGAQLEIGSVATAYQGTLTQLDIVETSKSDCWYIKADGIDDFLVTNNIDFTATDKMSLFTGMRKLSDVATAVVTEFSSDSITVNGSFGLFAPASNGATKYQFLSRGTTGTNYAQALNPIHNAPLSAVIRGIGTISTQKAEIYVNGILAGNSPTGLSGNGNYGSYPLYIGRRNGASLPFNGNIYSLVGISRLTTDVETVRLEKAIAKLSGVTL